MQNGDSKLSPWPATKEELADFWAHRVYHKALTILTVSFTLGALLLGTAAWFSLTEAERRIESNIAAKADQAIETELKPFLQRSMANNR
jgi:hypothetical protein